PARPVIGPMAGIQVVLSDASLCLLVSNGSHGVHCLPGGDAGTPVSHLAAGHSTSADRCSAGYRVCLLSSDPAVERGRRGSEARRPPFARHLDAVWYHLCFLAIR